MFALLKSNLVAPLVAGASSAASQAYDSYEQTVAASSKLALGTLDSLSETALASSVGTLVALDSLSENVRVVNELRTSKYGQQICAAELAICDVLAPTPELACRFPSPINGAASDSTLVVRCEPYERGPDERGFSCGFCLAGELVVVHLAAGADSGGAPLIRVQLDHKRIPQAFSVLIVPVGEQSFPVPFLSVPITSFGLLGLTLVAKVFLFHGDGGEKDGAPRPFDRMLVKLGLQFCVSDAWEVVSFHLPESPVPLFERTFPLSEVAALAAVASRLQGRLLSEASLLLR